MYRHNETRFRLITEVWAKFMCTSLHNLLPLAQYVTFASPLVNPIYITTKVTLVPPCAFQNVGAPNALGACIVFFYLKGCACRQMYLFRVLKKEESLLKQTYVKSDVQKLVIFSLLRKAFLNCKSLLSWILYWATNECHYCLHTSCTDVHMLFCDIFT